MVFSMLTGAASASTIPGLEPAAPQRTGLAHVIHSNRLEVLAAALVQHLNETPLADPFQQEIVLVPHPGMARWLRQYLASDIGIAAMVHCPLPGGFIWQQLEAVLGAQPAASAWSREALVWRITALLQTAEALPPALDRILDGLGDESLYGFAERLAAVFDEYLLYRADVLDRWSGGADEDWQAWIWRALERETAQPHRLELLRRFRAQLEQQHHGLPQRISLFGVGHLAPILRETLETMAASGVDVRWYFLNPCREYWHDLVSEKEWARLWRDDPERAAVSDVGHPLLPGLGQVTREQLARLLDPPWTHSDDLGFDSTAPSNALQHLKHGLLALDATPPAIDSSLQVHSTHNPLREVQALKDRLIAILQQHEDRGDPIRPHEIAILAPDIDDYRPIIDAVFSETPHIPVDLPQDAADHAVARAFVDVLDLLGSRWAAREILGVLEAQPLRARLKLSDTQLNWLARALTSLGVRWGRDATAVAEQGGATDARTDFAAGLGRLLAARALPEFTTWQGVATPPGAGLSSDLPGAVLRWLRQLTEFDRACAAPRPLSQWRSLLQAMLSASIAVDPDDEGGALALGRCQDAIADLGFAGDGLTLDLNVSWAVVRSALKTRLQDRSGAAPNFSGGVVCSSLASLRGVAFRVIVGLGFSEAVFPRRDRDHQLNRIRGGSRRSGDRSRRLEDRQAFLDLLLAARDALLISYVGRDPQTDEEVPAAAPVRELIEFCGPGLRVEHRLQPFAADYFDENDALYTFAPQWLRSIQAADAGPTPVRRLQSLTADPPTEIDVDDLVEFACQPARWFVKQRLGVVLRSSAPEVNDHSWWELDGLSRYWRLDTLLRADDPFDPEQWRAYLVRSGLVPPGQIGTVAADQLLADITELRERRAAWTAAPERPQWVDQRVANVRIRGWVRGVHGNTLVAARAARVKHGDALALWVRHQLLLPDFAGDAIHLGLRSEAEASEVRYDGASSVFQPPLEALVQAFLDSWTRPIPFRHQPPSKPNQARDDDYVAYVKSGFDEDEALTQRYVEATNMAVNVL